MSDSIAGDGKIRVQWKTVAAVGAATWLVTTQLAGCGAGDASGGEGEGEGGEGAMTQSALGGEGEGEGQAVTGGEGEGEGTGDEGEGAGGEGEGAGGEGEGGEGEGGEGEGGEGEGGEGEGEGAAADGADLATDDTAYLTQLALIRGHLAVGYALYQQDLPELAETHMKHPEAEIYTAVEPAFAARGCEGFAEGLTTLTAAVTERRSKDDVTAAYESLIAGISACEAVAAADDPAVIAGVIEDLLRTAGVEYQIGVIDGAIDNLHEYQDAWGFTQVAAALARSSAFAGDPAATAVAAQLQTLIDGLDGLWPSLNPDGTVEGEAAQLFGAAAQVEITALPLKR